MQAQSLVEWGSPPLCVSRHHLTRQEEGTDVSVDPKTLENFQDKQVILIIEGEDQNYEFEGKVEAASEAALGFKEKGKRDMVIIEPGQIVEISLAPEKIKKITSKKMKPVADGNMRQHLADRHGLKLEEVNRMSEEDAVKYHDKLDHSALAHRHEAPTEKSEEESAEQSAA